jgi:hypothetical protein
LSQENKTIVCSSKALAPVQQSCVVWIFQNASIRKKTIKMITDAKCLEATFNHPKSKEDTIQSILAIQYVQFVIWMCRTKSYDVKWISIRDNRRKITAYSDRICLNK